MVEKESSGPETSVTSVVSVTSVTSVIGVMVDICGVLLYERGNKVG